MNLRAYLFSLSAALFVLLVVVMLLRRRRLRERHAVWWLLAGVLALVVGAFPQTLSKAATVVGIDLPVNLVFFVSIAILFLVSIQHSSELTTLEAKARDLAETVALLQLRVDELSGDAVSSKDDRGALPEPPKDPDHER